MAAVARPDSDVQVIIQGPADLDKSHQDQTPQVPADAKPQQAPPGPMIQQDQQASRSIATTEPGQAKTVEISIGPQGPPSSRLPMPTEPNLPNGSDDVELVLPDKLTLMQLIELASEYLQIDYIYDPVKLKNEPISIRMHGKLAGKIKVRDLYELLQSVLRFKGLVMTRDKANLVWIVPASEALEAGPAIVDPNMDTAIGQTVATIALQIEYTDPAGVKAMLEGLKVPIAISQAGNRLLVTCYRSQMDRIERLVGMLDTPGRPRVFRSRQLRYTSAKDMAEKLTQLARQIEGTYEQTTQEEKRPFSELLKSSKTAETAATSSISTTPSRPYIEPDQRTNRLLIIGQLHQIATIEALIDQLDLSAPDTHRLAIYPVKNIEASKAASKLNQLGLTKAWQPAPMPSDQSGQGKSAVSDQYTQPGQCKMVALESVNALLVWADDEMHNRVLQALSLIDMPTTDLRSLRLYRLRRIDASMLEKKLKDLQIIPKDGTTAIPTPASPATGPSQPDQQAAQLVSANISPQVSVVESINALLVRATDDIHNQIQSIIELLDKDLPQEAIPYQIYFLENQSPQQLAEVLGKIVQQTIANKDTKIERPIPSPEDQIIIVPDQATFSLIVYASKKNQQWIEGLIRQLDRRRPQVLIDVTLVEIRKTDQFTYDLSMAATRSQQAPRPAGTIWDPNAPTLQVISGQFTGFYLDSHISALLVAVESKNYGRVLARPKILVNDNEKGVIKTTETTYVTKRSSIPVSTGAAGQQSTLIETAVDYQGYDAGVTLEITPHIGEGNLLRLEIAATRSDFARTPQDRPPDKISSDLNTVVTVPDQSTIILGGMLKLNQTRGGSKVPILGDLPLVGLLFRGISNTDTQSRLYIFVRAQIIRPDGLEDLQRISDIDRQSFQQAERQFQQYPDIPGIQPRPTEPREVLDTR
jgi:type II secretory pathway component GspD/PulD (secretin)